jgi:radical SAM superfamily enzyme YgiQ (UPF0313 family)
MLGSQTPGNPSVLLVGPYDPSCGEYTFVAPPLGVWRLAGVLASSGIDVEVFDPNCCEGEPPRALERLLRRRHWDVLGVSTTGMTLQFDLELAHLGRRLEPDATIVAGGMEATFRPDLMFELGPFDCVVLGEGEKPLIEIVNRRRQGATLFGIPGTVVRTSRGLERHHQAALSPQELRAAIAATPYERMPYQTYWQRLEDCYLVDGLPTKAEREARLSEIRSVRLITLNYCPMGCTFCSSTNFLHAAQGGTAPVTRLEAEDCLAMVKRIVSAQPDVRTIIFQDDIFVFTSDKRVLPLCEAIADAKASGALPESLQFISTNRIDSMTPERLAAMRKAGFRVLGFGVENFSRRVLIEFNKARIHAHIDATLQEALRLGITPFLDLILTSPRCGIEDVAESVRQAYRWLAAGCEIGMYPYVIPFSGAPIASDPTLKAATIFTRRHVSGTDVTWDQPTKILPVDPVVRAAIQQIEEDFNAQLHYLEQDVAHLPSRVRSLLWITSAIPVLDALGVRVPPRHEVLNHLIRQLPVTNERRDDVRQRLAAEPMAVHA